MITTHILRRASTGARLAPAPASALAAHVPHRPVLHSWVSGEPGRCLLSRRASTTNRSTPAGRTIPFNDPQAYECMMGTWSRLVGEVFLNWLAQPSQRRWLDAGCGNGKFTSLILERCAPVSVHGLDPERSQIEFARHRGDAQGAQFLQGDVADLPFPNECFDIGVMALVLVFLPDPARGLAEMVRVLAPGGTACAYNWDLDGGGSPLSALGLAMRQAGVPADVAHSESVSGETAVRRLWLEAGLQDVQTRKITVHRRFDSLDDAWKNSCLGASVVQVLSRLDDKTLAQVKARFAENVQQDIRGEIVMTGTAVAVKGVKRR